MALDSGVLFDMYATIFGWRQEDKASNHVDHNFISCSRNPAPLARSTAAEKDVTKSRRLDSLVTTDVNFNPFSLLLSSVGYLRPVMPLLHEDLARLKFLTPAE